MYNLRGDNYANALKALEEQQAATDHAWDAGIITDARANELGATLYRKGLLLEINFSVKDESLVSALQEAAYLYAEAMTMVDILIARLELWDSPAIDALIDALRGIFLTACTNLEDAIPLAAMGRSMELEMCAREAQAQWIQYVEMYDGVKEIADALDAPAKTGCCAKLGCLKDRSA